MNGMTRPKWLEWPGSIRGILLSAVARFADTLSAPGLLIATLFFSGSLTPSLVPRTWATQGVLSGFSLAAGYGVGVFGRWLWEYLELPLPRAWIQRGASLVATGLTITTALVFLRSAAEWQNSIRLLMELPPVDSAQPFRVGAIATIVGVLLLGTGRAFLLVLRTLIRWLDAHLPRRVAKVLGTVAAMALFWILINGVVFEAAVRAADRSAGRVDALIQPDLLQPADPLRTGSATSLLDWNDLGRRGREFVASTSDRSEILGFLAAGEGGSGEAGAGGILDPIRVYVGLNSAETIQERARLALDELLRVGAFERSLLVIGTPTGTGWVDPIAIGTLEYLYRGDVATVSVQYSYLPSWLSLLVQPEIGEATARAVFSEVYDHWIHLPRESRPRLYLFGLSLGALYSEGSIDLYDVIGDPVQGALWTGPPYRSTRWQTLVAEREPDSPAWLPRFRDGTVVRFANQVTGLDFPGAEWGPLRIVYLQYASDPITFFDERAVVRPPAWLAEPRGPDVSPELRWYPVVTALQLAVDILAANSAPPGFGHTYAAEDYIDAWMEVTSPEGWSPEEVVRLKRYFGEIQRQ